MIAGLGEFSVPWSFDVSKYALCRKGRQEPKGLGPRRNRKAERNDV